MKTVDFDTSRKKTAITSRGSVYVGGLREELGFLVEARGDFQWESLSIGNVGTLLFPFMIDSF